MSRHRVSGDQPYSLARRLRAEGIGAGFDGIVEVTEGATVRRKTDEPATLMMHSCSLADLRALCVFEPGVPAIALADENCRVHYPGIPLPAQHHAVAYRWIARLHVIGDDRIRISQPLMAIAAGIPDWLTGRHAPLGYAGDLHEAAERLHYGGDVGELIADRGFMLWDVRHRGVRLRNGVIGFDDPTMVPLVQRLEELRREIPAHVFA